MQKKIAIIGAGISGLSAGCYAQMNGYAAQLFEAHTLPGGLCTSWKRKGYTIDGSCHWVTGSGPGDPYYAVWEELGAIQGRHYIDYEYFTRSAGTDGRVFSLYTDVDRLERHMKELSPADAEPTELFCGFIRSLGGFSMPVGKPGELMGIRDGIRMMRKFRPYMKLLKLLGEMTVNQLGAQFKDPLLRDVLEHAMYGASASVFPLVFTLATMNGKQAGYPLGGSLEFARAIEARLRDLGGTITYGAPVRKILERNGRTIGVQLADGREIEADYVVSACDMRSTLFELLDGSRIHPIHTELLDSGTLIPPMLQVSYGVDVDFS
ncbi:MAG TPA: NAD(P)/FAD-dependent oxidoreductase, partial [Spirochaetia bacterium]|nr:NAD(P)/FAD-dependent oxidoreductase [Spirochaetia bacterium]